jgi:aspartyl-tRNA(Asn)/glutamyl-tRNA(Gln) amidotransferase subunit A
LARTVQDCAFADAVMAGEEPRELNPYPLAGLRIGVPRGRLFAQTEPMVEQAFEASLTLLSRAGARIVDHGIEDLLEAMADTTVAASIASIEASEVHADWLEERAAEIDPRVRWWIARSGSVPAPVYIRMLRRRRALVAAMDGRLSPLDMLALPTTAISAPLIAPLKADDKLYNKMDGLILRNTMFGNQFDLTGISLPIPRTERPVGLMLVARHGHDRRLLDMAAGVERALTA